MSEEKDEHWYSICPSCGIKTLIPIKNLEQENKELRTRVAELEKKVEEYEATKQTDRSFEALMNYQLKLNELQNRLSTLLKASEGMAECLPSGHEEVEDGFYSCPKAENYFGQYEGTPIEKRPCYCGYDKAANALADFRAVRGDK